MSHSKNDDLHGNVPDRCPVALLLVDVINDLDFPGNAAVVKSNAQVKQAYRSGEHHYIVPPRLDEATRQSRLKKQVKQK